MKRLILLLLVCVLLPVLPALAEDAPGEAVTLTTPDGLTVTHAVNGSPYILYSDAELLIQHYCTMGEYEKAFWLNEQLANLGDTDALYRLGCQYLSGLGTAKDESAALECFTTARDAGSTDAALALILARLNGWGMPQDTLGTAAELNALAQQGQFRYELALLYLHGAHDIPAHEATATYWFDQRCSYRKETDPARYEAALAAFLATSPTILTDPLPVQHENWDNTAAKAAMGLALGQFWQEGRGGVTDMQSAAFWYEFTSALPNARQTAWANAALADMHLSGVLGAVDVEKAIGYFQQPQDPDGYGAYRIGIMYWDGVTGADGTVHLAADTTLALSWLEKATAYNPACKLLGDAYRTGERVPADPRTAAHYYALGLNNSDTTECYDPLLQMYQEGLLYDRAVMDGIWAGLRYWRGTDHQLAIRLAADWLNGKTAEDGTVLVQQDRKAAFQLMDDFRTVHARLHDDPEVFILNWLGWFYSGNAPEAVARDYAKALDCYIESANAGNGYAMAMAGVFYQNGRGMPVDHMTARAWYRKAIAAGYTGAQGYLDALNVAYPEYPVDLFATLTTSQGLTLTHTVNRTDGSAFTDAELLAAGYAMEGLWALALEINEQLAALNDVDAMYRLGCHYASGLGVQPDDALAVEWLRKAADAGCGDAVFALGCMYLNGWGVKQDAPKGAAMLETLAAFDADRSELPFQLATLYHSGHATLAADADKALAFLHTDDPSVLEASTAPDERLLTRPQPMMYAWLNDPAAVCVGMATFWTEGRGGAADLTESIRWYENALRIDPTCLAASQPLAELLRDGTAGYCDAQRAITLFMAAGACDKVGAMFDTGVTGPDGRVSLAPNAIIAEAFHTWAAEPGNVDAGIRLGDLFRDGSIVTANPNLAAAFYWRTTGSPYCADQLTALVEAGLVTDEALLAEIAASQTN